LVLWVGIYVLVFGVAVLTIYVFVCARRVEHFPDGRIRFLSSIRTVTYGSGELRSVRRVPVLFDLLTLLPMMVSGESGRILLFPRMSEVKTMISAILRENPQAKVAKIWPGRM
jgi:hypothetical protein